MPPPPQNITILGAGITGLQTALTLATAPSPPSSITLIAQYLPGNTHPTYTSPWAGGHWRSHASSAPKDALARAWDARTYAVWRNLLAFGDGTPGTEKETVEEREKRIGLGVRTSFNYWGTHTPETVAQGEGLWWRDVVDGFEVLSEEELGKGVVFGVKYESVCINVPRYLEYMFERVKRCGVRVINTTFETGAGLRGVVDDVKVILKREGLESPDIIINATGLSARLFADEDEQANLTPIRGQTVLVKGEAKAARTITHFGLEDEVAYVIPRVGSGTTILGGCKQSGNSDEMVDGALSERILRRIRDWGMADELLRWEGGGFEVLSEQVGFRPGRRGGVRCEVEGGGRVGGVWVVHCYGHAGAGFQASVGCAEGVREIIRGVGGRGKGRGSKL